MAFSRNSFVKLWRCTKYEYFSLWLLSIGLAASGSPVTKANSLTELNENSTWIQRPNSSFEYILVMTNSSLSWEEAEEHCENSPSTLVMLPTRGDLSYVLDIIKTALDLPPVEIPLFYIGLTWRLDYLQWIKKSSKVTEAQIQFLKIRTFANDLNSQDKDSDLQKCFGLNSDGELEYFDCDKKQSTFFICQRPKKDPKSCSDSPCKNGNCTEKSTGGEDAPGFRCKCQKDYSGERCEIKNQCGGSSDQGTCSGHGKCEQLGGATILLRCNCDPGFDGQHCQRKVKLTCDSNPCHANSTCVNMPQDDEGFRCECSKDYTGQLCETLMTKNETTPVSLLHSDSVQSEKMSSGLLAGIIGGLILFLIILTVIIIFIVKKSAADKVDETASTSESLLLEGNGRQYYELNELRASNESSITDTDQIPAATIQTLLDTEQSFDSGLYDELNPAYIPPNRDAGIIAVSLGNGLAHAAGISPQKVEPIYSQIIKPPKTSVIMIQDVTPCDDTAPDSYSVENITTGALENSRSDSLQNFRAYSLEKLCPNHDDRYWHANDGYVEVPPPKPCSTNMFGNDYVTHVDTATETYCE